MSELPFIPKEQQLSPYVTRILGRNPSSFTLQGTNTYLVGSPKHKERILIDTGSGFDEYVKHLRNYLRRKRLVLTAVVITHWHPDHFGGLNDVIKLAPNATLYKYRAPETELNSSTYNFKHWADGQVLEVGGVHLTAYFTPGHCDDHISIWLEEEHALFSGDNLLGHGSAVFKDYSVYMDSLRRMRDLPNLGVVYPGHGLPIPDGVAGFNQYIEHRYQREYEVFNVLKKNDAMTDEELVNRLYEGLDGRPTKVKLGALSNTQHYLSKLQRDGRVAFDGTKWRARL